MDEEAQRHEPDFRSKRVRLHPEDFAWSGNAEIGPTDQVSKKVWRSMTSLPDDVSLRTSDHYGSLLKLADDLSNQSVCLAYALQQSSKHSAIAHTTGDAVEHFQASIYNAMTGYYRFGFTSLRAIVENMTIGTYFHITDAQHEFGAWLAGEEFWFGRVANDLMQHAHIVDLEQKLEAATGDSLYCRRTSTDPGGFVRRLFGELSKYAHGAPGYNDGDMWRSNGPIFVSQVFQKWGETFLTVYSLTVLLSRLADRTLEKLGFNSAFTARGLFHHVINRLPPSSDARRLFSVVPDDMWK